MKKENIFDLYDAPHQDDRAPAADRVPGEVKPEDMTPTQEVTQAPEPTQETAPEPPQEPEQNPQEGGNGVGA